MKKLFVLVFAILLFGGLVSAGFWGDLWDRITGEGDEVQFSPADIRWDINGDGVIDAIVGDVNGDKDTNLIDMAFVKSKNGDNSDLRFDVNLDGSVNLIDMALVKSLNGATVDVTSVCYGNVCELFNGTSLDLVVNGVTYIVAWTGINEVEDYIVLSINGQEFEMRDGRIVGQGWKLIGDSAIVGGINVSVLRIFDNSIGVYDAVRFRYEEVEIVEGNVVEVSGCRVLDETGVTYRLVQDISASGDCFLVEADNIVLDGNGFTITGDGTGNGVKSSRNNLLTIKNLSVSNFASGLWLAGVEDVLIEDSKINGNKRGIYAGDSVISKRVVIRNNEVNDNYNINGITFYYKVEDSVIENNLINDNAQDGILLNSDTQNILVVGNEINENGRNGIRLTPSLGSYFNRNHVIRGNNFIGNNWYGIDSSGASHTLFEGNIVRLTKSTSNEFAGIRIYQGENLTLAENTINENLASGLILSSTKNNTIKKNIISSNQKDGIYLYGVESSLIDDNEANDNGEYGFRFYADNKGNVVTNNRASGNGFLAMLIDFIQRLINSIFGNSFDDACSDGSSSGECSSNKPLYCDSNFDLVDNCQVCGCDSGECLANGQCFTDTSDYDCDYSLVDSEGYYSGGWGNWGEGLVISETENNDDWSDADLINSLIINQEIMIEGTISSFEDIDIYKIVYPFGGDESVFVRFRNDGADPYNNLRVGMFYEDVDLADIGYVTASDPISLWPKLYNNGIQKDYVYLIVHGNGDLAVSEGYEIELIITNACFELYRPVQKILLDFNGAENVQIWRRPWFDIPVFDAGDIDPSFASYTQQIKDGILQKVREDYADYNVEVYSTDEVSEIEGDHITVYFGGYDNQLLGLADEIDSYNLNKNNELSEAQVFIETFGLYMVLNPSLQEMTNFLSNVASHEAGHLLGLRHTKDEDSIMDTSTTARKMMEEQWFKRADLHPTVINFDPGYQNEPELLKRNVGLDGNG